MKSKKRFGLRAIAIAVAVTFVATLAGTLLTATLLIGPGGFTLLQGAGLIHTMFVGEYETDDMLDAAMNGMVAGIGDRWSFYVNEAQYKDMSMSRQNNYVGIGITVSFEREEGLLLDRVEPGGPAEQAGLKAGDVIIAADGVSLAGEARYDGTEHIRGEAGTQVTLTVLRADDREETVTVTRAMVVSHPARSEMLEGEIGLITLSNFFERSAQESIAEVDALVAQGAKALIFDMRGNPGGYLDEMLALLDYLLPEGPIFTTHSKNGPVQTTESDAGCIDLPMAVLVDADTYSAAELFAAQLRESVGAVIAGTRTSGKGYSQLTFPLPNGGALALSTSMYTTGNGTSLIGVGILPDIELEYEGGEDNQLDAIVARVQADLSK